MALRVGQLELERGVPLALADGRGVDPLLLLVRSAGRPVGCLYCAAEAAVDEAQLRDECEMRLAPQLAKIAFERQLGGDRKVPNAELPPLTVAVCTRGRPSSLVRALDSLERLDYPQDALELLVVDNAPVDDEVRRLVEARPRLRYVLEPRPGLDRARNRALAEARGAVVAFTDDDVEVDPSWVRSLAPHFADPAVVAVTGLVLPARLETHAQELFEAYGGFGRGFEARYHTLGTRRYWRWWPLGAGIFGTGCNMAFRKSTCTALGGFDPALDVGSPAQGAGDLDLFYRTLRAGGILVYEPRALVWHHHRREWGELRRQLRCFGRGVYAFWTKTLLTDRGMRRRTLEFALLWFCKGLLGRLVRNRGLPRALVLAEVLGAVEGPAAWFISRLHARRSDRQSVATAGGPPDAASPANEARRRAADEGR